MKLTDSMTAAVTWSTYARNRFWIGTYPRLPVNILDVGGGPGAYSSWLAEKGHKVHLIDPVPRHLKEAEETHQKAPSKKHPEGRCA